MKRIATCLIMAMFLASCGDSKYAEDTDTSSREESVVADTEPQAEAEAREEVGTSANDAVQAEQNWVDAVSKTADGGYRMGNPEASIQLVAYSSRTCGQCATFAIAADGPLKAYVAKGDVSFEFRDVLLNPIDVGAALSGQCGSPESFFPILDQMFAQQSTLMGNGPKQGDPFITEVEAMAPQQRISAMAEKFGFLALVQQYGIPEAQVRQCLQDAAATQALVASAEAGQKQFNIAATPTFILNGKVLEIMGTWEQVDAALKAAGA